MAILTFVSPAQKSIFEKELQNLAKRIKKSNHLVILTGAGISTESGLPDYRGPNGLWTYLKKGISNNKKAKSFNKFKPTTGHKAITELYRKGYMKFLITQNIDNLHRKAGIPEKAIAEIHGNYNYLRCSNCDKRYSLHEQNINNTLQSISDPIAGTKVSKECSTCGGKIIPTYVSFGSPLPESDIQRANDNASTSDVFIAIGSTLTVEPASILPKKAKNNNAYVVIINNARTAYDLKADLIIQGQIEEILPKIVKYVNKKK